MLIADILTQKGHDRTVAAPGDTVENAVRLLSDRGIGAVVITEGGRLSGIFSERDLVRLLARDGSAGLSRPLRDAMVTPVITCKPDDQVGHVLAVMNQRRIRHAPVMGPDGLAGMISIRDLVRSRLTEKEVEAATLLDISRLHG